MMPDLSIPLSSLPDASTLAEAIAQRCAKTKSTGAGWQACCPAHEDDTPSLSITPTADKVLLHCFAGCPPEAIVAALGLRMADLFIRTETYRGKRIIATYDYLDAIGTLVHQTVRFEPTGKDKDFKQRRPDPTTLDAWIWNLKSIQTVLYHLPQIAAAIAAGQPVYVVEGEKDADALMARGLTATCNPMGAGKWKKSYSDALRGAKVVILPDHDAPGAEHAAKVARYLHGIAAEVKIVAGVHTDAPSSDVSDWLQAGHSRAELEALVEQAPAYTPAAAKPASVIMASGTPAQTAGALPYGDTYNAKRLVGEHGADLRYCGPWHKWLTWSGTHWQLDDTGKLMRRAKETILRLMDLVKDLPTVVQQQMLLAHIKSSLATAKLRAMIENAQSELPMPVLPVNLDRDPWLLNCLSGTIDLHTGTLQPHRREDLLTRCIDVPFDPGAACPIWEKFLWRIMGGPDRSKDSADDSALTLENRQAADARARRFIAFLQRVIGYSLTSDTREQCLFILHGAGSNGKSTFLEVLQALLGEYGQSTPSATLLVKDRHEGIPNDIARLRGARLVTAVEIGENKRLNEELVKRLTGQDTMTGRFLHAEFFDFTPEFKLWLACNHLPQIRGTDHAIWRRVKRIPFAVTIPDAEQDKTLPSKLRAELPGILQWAIRGCLAWQREGLMVPEEVQTATQEYRASQDAIGRFLEEECVKQSYAKVKASILYENYKTWCVANGEQYAPQRTFGMSLTEREFKRTPEGTGIFWHGIGLPAPEEKSDKRD